MPYRRTSPGRPAHPGCAHRGPAPLAARRTDSQRAFAAARRVRGARGQDALQKRSRICGRLSPTTRLASSKLDACRYAWRTPTPMTMLVVEFREIGQRMTAAQPNNSSLGPDGGSHAVHFYESDDELSVRVAAFIGEALQAGEPAVMIAAPAHRQQFIARLTARTVDVEANEIGGKSHHSGRGKNPRKVHGRHLRSGAVHGRGIGSLLESIGTRGNRRVKVRAYGEMVDLLWRDANQSAAIALEEMWTDLGAVYPFDLLCAYAMATLAAGTSATGVRDICGERRTSQSPRRWTAAPTRQRRSPTSANRRAIWPRRSRDASRPRRPCAAPYES